MIQQMQKERDALLAQSAAPAAVQAASYKDMLQKNKQRKTGASPQEKSVARDLDKLQTKSPIVPKKKQIVVDLENVASFWGQHRLGREKGNREGLPVFDWHGARFILRHLTEEKNFDVIVVIMPGYIATDADNSDTKCTMPADIRRMCSQGGSRIIDAPRTRERCHKSIDDELVISIAFDHKCMFLSNDLYRDWKKHLQDAKVKDWLASESSENLHIHYTLDKYAKHGFRTCYGLRTQA